MKVLLKSFETFSNINLKKRKNGNIELCKEIDKNIQELTFKWFVNLKLQF